MSSSTFCLQRRISLIMTKFYIVLPKRRTLIYEINVRYSTLLDEYCVWRNKATSGLSINDRLKHINNLKGSRWPFWGILIYKMWISFEYTLIMWILRAIEQCVGYSYMDLAGTRASADRNTKHIRRAEIFALIMLIVSRSRLFPHMPTRAFIVLPGISRPMIKITRSWGRLTL